VGIHLLRSLNENYLLTAHPTTPLITAVTGIATIVKGRGR